MSQTVEYYLDLYQTRLEMQEAGMTDPPTEIKQFTRAFVTALSALPLDAEIRLENDAFFDANGNLILKFPSEEG